jgi:uncharacterized protein
MEFEWDEAKEARCQRERGFSFGYASEAFADPKRQIEPDERTEYGEIRFRLVGLIEGRVYVVIFTMRGQKARIISARRANRREQVHYHSRQAGR